ncbi:MAG: RHS repeat protein, partial [Rhodanobacteraceae bacterium]|nr:RHS repeat protein [Rhodanobacteraceae bacterium]
MPALAALLMPLSWSPKTQAQTSPVLPNDFCFSYQNLWQCYPSMPQAMAGMKAALPASYRNVIFPKTPYPTGQIAWDTGLEEWRVDFYVPDQPPEHTFPRGYYQGWRGAPDVCPSAGDPLYPHLCKTEDGATEALYGYMVNTYPQCTHVRLNYANSWASPFARISAYNWTSRYGVISYTNPNLPPAGNRKYEYTVQCPGWNPPGPVTREINLSSQQTFLCPEDFKPVEGYGAAQYSNGGALPIISRALCRAGTMPYIVYKERQTASCPAGNSPGPCHPATGDKSRNEVDFAFAGVAFTRYYHSLHQTGTIPAFAPGWTHTFSDRVLDGGSTNMRIIRSDGNVEYFLPLGNNEYKSSQTTRKKLVKLSDGYRIYDETGKVLFFNTAGRLVRQERSLSGLLAIDFSYDGDKLVRAQDQSGRTLHFVYTDGRLSSITLPDGRVVEYHYDASTNFERATYPDGSSKRYHYNEAGLSLANDPHALTGITTENGLRYSTYGYNINGRVTLSQRHKGDGTFVEKTTVDYSNPQQPVATLPYGEVVTYNLTPERAYTRITGMTSSRGSYYANYTGSGSGATLVGYTGGRTTRYVFTESYESERYEAYGTPDERKFVTVRDPAYRTTSREIQTKSGTSYVTKQRHSYTYNSRGQMLTASITDPASSASRTTTLAYCEQTDVSAGSCPLVGLLKSVDGPRSDVVDVTTFAYRAADEASCASSPLTCQYRKGDLWTVTNALGHATEVLKLDASGRPQSVRDANGVLTDFEYDMRGRLTARKQRGADNSGESDDRILGIEYWPTGLVKQITQPDGSYTAYDYDDAHRLTSIRDNAGNRIEYTLSTASQRIKQETKDPNGVLKHSLSRTYTTLDQLQSQIDAYGRATTFSYDVNENPDRATDALSRISDSDHDGLDRLKRVLQDVSGIAAETTLGYDALDNVTRVTDPKGLDTLYTYNGLGDQTQLQSPDTGTTTYSYDEAGNLASRIDANGKSISYRYDALNRLKMVDYAAAVPDETFAYDVAMGDCPTGENFNIGRLGKMNDESGSTTFCYNRFGDLVRKVQRTSSKTFTLRWNYAATGRLQSMTYPDGSVVDYVYDVHGRVSEIGVTPLRSSREVLISAIAYYPFGPVAQWTFGNGRTLTRSYNLNYQPYSVQDTAAGGLSLGYEFDAVGNLKRLRNADQADPPARIYDYDGLNRLTEAKDAANVIWQNYSYDKTGNRLSAGLTTATTTQSCPQGQGGPCTTGTQLVWSSFAYAYANGSHHLLSAGDGAQRSYDAAGNLSTVTPVAPVTPRAMVSRNYVYNEAGRLGSVTSTGVLQATYRYNSYGQRVYRQTPTGTVYTLYDQAGHWLGDYDTNGAALQQTIWLGDLPVGVQARMPGGATQLHYIEADMLGTPRVVINPQRNVAVWRWDLTSEAFGDSEPNQDPDGDGNWFVLDMRFPGQRYDAPSGLNYNYFRDYEAFTGRYSQ